MKEPRDCPLVNRELSWLHFNARVLQEAENPAVPLYERLNYLAIFSSNLDEFFSVRVAALRSLLRLNKPAKGLDEDPAEVLAAIHETVHGLQERFGGVLRESVLPALASIGMPLVRAEHLQERERMDLQALFARDIRPHLQPLVLAEETPLLQHQQVYLACELWPRGSAAGDGAEAEPDIGLVALPAGGVGRFVRLASEGHTRVLFLEDAIRAFLGDLFPDFQPGPAHSFKVSRDADLYLGDCLDDALADEFGRRFRTRLRKSLEKRGLGTPTRFLFDPEMPARLIRALQRRFGLADEDLMPGGRYHHLRDLRSYPRPEATSPELCFAPQPPQPHPVLSGAASLFDAVRARDHLLVLPYQQFDPVVRWVEEAAGDPNVARIAVTIYRTARESALTQRLMDAAAAGKRVEAVVELKARFDEANNLDVAEELEQAGARVHVTPCELKVHAKLILIERREGEALRRYAYLSTGNLNEQTATLYTDFGLFTADPRLTDEVARLFEEMTSEEMAAEEMMPEAEPAYATLLVAPRTLRSELYRLIDAEVARARRGEEAWLFFKMNALEDPKMIRRLCEAAEAGVQMRLLVRGICRLSPTDVAGGERIEIRSIVGRYLEHGRAYVFGNGGAPRVYLGSADLMRRNLSHRIEVLFPVLDPALADEVRAYLDLQWADTLKARRVEASGANLFVQPAPGSQPLSSQELLYTRYGGHVSHAPPPPPPDAQRTRPADDATAAAYAPPRSFGGRVLEWVETHPVRSSILLAALLLSLPLAPILIHAARTVREPARNAAAVASMRASYHAHRPDTVLTLPAELAEISGQALLGDTLLAAVQDEQGTLFFVDPRTGQIVHTHDFAEDGDYEEVALTPEGLFVLNSAGALFHVADWSGPASEAEVIETPLSRDCDSEGMAYDAAANRLLISCKEDPGKGLDVGATFAFDLATRTMSETPVLELDLDAIAAALRHADENPATATLARALNLDDFKPSALGIHPLNGQLYIVSSKPPSIAVLSPEGRLLGAELLPEGTFPQPEGIAFFANGDMLISSEAAEGGTGRLARFRYLNR